MTTENTPSGEERVRKVYVRDLREKERVRTVFRVLRKARVTARSGKSFLALTFADRTGLVDGRVFERVDELEPTFLVNDYVLVSGQVTTFHGKPQVVAESLERLDPGPIDEAEFTPPPEALEALQGAEQPREPRKERERPPREEREERPREEREERAEVAAGEEGRRSLTAIREMAERVADPNVRALLLAFLDDASVAESLRTAQGPKGGPRPYRGGLADGLASAMRLVLRVAEHYPAADRDLLVAGAFLQGVMRAQDADAARLVGPQVLAAQALRERARTLPDFPALLEQHLTHLVLASEDPRAPGAARPAVTLEAELLRSLVSLDSRLAVWMDAMARDPHDTWTEPLKADGRSLWKGPVPTQRGRSPVEARRKKKPKAERPEKAAGGPPPRREAEARPPKEPREAREPKEPREAREPKEPREARPPRTLPSELTFKPFSALMGGEEPSEGTKPPGGEGDTSGGEG